ncbi:large ribosomal subunit protein uL2mz, N-terminal part-like [Rutidosis leptorrhynchoides]|uniref:large ribosomal subunit protein uL2mz, N-terminal part-like n=1 Tax=Rutidosis leptorrhynchoides TaxID=125765 RepID=UPI003A9A33A1
MATSSYCRRLLNGSSSLISSGINSTQIRSKHTITRAKTVVSSERPLRQFVSGKSKSAGRNSKGRITIFHRGGGAKRSQRTIDLKRNTSSVGVVERIEYDPNRTSRIAVVRWEEGADVDRYKKVNAVENFGPPRKVLPTMSINSQGQFSFCSLPGMIEDRRVVSSVPKRDHVMVGLPHGSKSPFTDEASPAVSKMTDVKDVFISAFSSAKAKGNNAPYSFVKALGLPRMAVAGAKPDFFVPRMKDDVKENDGLSLNEIKKWDKDSIVWAHKMKPKAAVSWQSLRRQEILGPVGIAGQGKSKLKLKAMESVKRDGKFTSDRSPVTYILATHQMEVGKMVMNYDSSKRSNDKLLNRY